MKQRILRVLLIAVILSGCGSAPSLVATSTPTGTATITPTPLQTATSTPIPTPMGGAGGLMLVIDQELWIINTDGSELEVLIPRERFEERFSTDIFSLRLAKISPDGQKILVLACGDELCTRNNFFLSTTDSTQLWRFLGYRRGILEWAPTSDKILMQDPFQEEGKQVISAAGHNFGELVHSFDASVAFWSFDGAQVYYYHENTWYVVNSDGSGLHTVECAICSVMPELSLNAVSQSPDGQWLAIATEENAVIITRPDFAHFKIVKFENYVRSLNWSPDSKKLIADIYTGQNQSRTVILAQDGSLLEELQYPEGSPFVNVCGWSPDGKLLDYLVYFPSGYKLYLYELDTQESMELLSFQPKDESCPVWLPTNS